MLDNATLDNKRKIAKHCIDARAQVAFQNPYDLHLAIVTSNFYETRKVIIEHSLNINNNIENYGDIVFNILWKTTTLTRFGFG